MQYTTIRFGAPTKVILLHVTRVSNNNNNTTFILRHEARGHRGAWWR